jgi:hypothetical protein
LFQFPFIGGTTPKSPWGICLFIYFLFGAPTPKIVGPFRGPTPKNSGEKKYRGFNVERTVCRQSSGCPKYLGVGTPIFGSFLTKTLFLLCPVGYLS